MLKILPLIAVSILVLQSCSVHQVRTHVDPPFTMTNEFERDGTVQAPDQWWTAFDEPTLNQLMNQALQDNLDLASAWARLSQFVAIAKREGADLVPTVSADSRVSRSHSEAGGRTIDVDNFQLGLSASYEVDLWNRIEYQQKAALLDVDVSRENLEATALVISSQIAKNWFRVLEQKEQLQLLEEQEETNEILLELNELRFSQGLATAVDVFQQRTHLANTRAQFPLAQSQLAVQQNRLHVLIGESPNPETFWTEEDFPALPPLPDAGLPIELLEKRPDIRAIMLQILATDYRVGAAIANQYPALSLSGSTGIDGENIGDMFSNWFWNLASSAFQPIIDGGLREAEVERNQAVLQQNLFDYEQTILLAIEDVENALIQERNQREYIDRLETEIEMSQNQLNEARSRFMNGLSDYLPVLTALQNLHRSQRNFITAQRLLLEYRVDLYVALGGDWTTRWADQYTPPVIESKGTI